MNHRLRRCRSGSESLSTIRQQRRAGNRAHSKCVEIFLQYRPDRSWQVSSLSKLYSGESFPALFRFLRSQLPWSRHVDFPLWNDFKTWQSKSINDYFERRPSNSEISSSCQPNAFSSSGKIKLDVSKIKVFSLANPFWIAQTSISYNYDTMEYSHRMNLSWSFIVLTDASQTSSLTQMIDAPCEQDRRLAVYSSFQTWW